MRKITPPYLDACRVVTGKYRSTRLDGLVGAFYVVYRPEAVFRTNEITPPDKRMCMFVISHDGIKGHQTGWEHVSVSLSNRCPTWDEMQFIKALFWAPEETVLQFHPAITEYVNMSKYCLHLWRRIGVKVELPPRELLIA